jgi:hypothetical protein
MEQKQQRPFECEPEFFDLQLVRHLFSNLTVSNNDEKCSNQSGIVLNSLSCSMNWHWWDIHVCCWCQAWEGFNRKMKINMFSNYWRHSISVNISQRWCWLVALRMPFSMDWPVEWTHHRDDSCGMPFDDWWMKINQSFHSPNLLRNLFNLFSMEECEMLCSSVAIMVNGAFRCLGSTQHLKDRFGDGCSIEIRLFKSSLDPSTIDPTIVDFFSTNFILKERHINTLHYKLAEELVSAEKISIKLEDLLNRGCTSDYRVSRNNLDNVFCQFRPWSMWHWTANNKNFASTTMTRDTVSLKKLSTNVVACDCRRTTRILEALNCSNVIHFATISFFRVLSWKNQPANSINRIENLFIFICVFCLALLPYRCRCSSRCWTGDHQSTIDRRSLRWHENGWTRMGDGSSRSK